MKIAVIDLGSISARMTIWAENKVIYQNRIAVRLSEGLAETGLLQTNAKERTLSALSLFGEVIKKENPTLVRAVCTEAVRRADNKEEFISTVYEKTGLKLEILSGEDEAYYDYLACRDLIGDKNALILDMGGGSFELISVKSGKVESHISLPHGAVVTTDTVKDKNKLLPFFERLFESLDIKKADRIIAMGGSARCACLYIKDKASCDIKPSELTSAYEKLLAMDDARLSEISAFSGRADVILAGIAPFVALATLSGAEKICVTSNGLREGIYKECLS